MEYLRWPKAGGNASLAGPRVLESFLEEILLNLFTGHTREWPSWQRNDYVLRYRAFNSPEYLGIVSGLCSALRRTLWYQ